MAFSPLVESLKNIKLPPAMRFPEFRAFWIGTLASVLGFQIFQFSQFLLVHNLTGSSLQLGYVGLANAVPAIALNLVGGVFADKLDKRVLIVITQALTACLIIVAAILTLADAIAVWHVLVIAFLAGIVLAFDVPARQAIYIHLVDRESLPSAIALNSSIWQGVRIAGPAIAGTIVALMGGTSGYEERVGIAISFFLSGAGAFFMMLVLLRLRGVMTRSGETTASLKALIDGLHFVRSNSLVLFLLLMTYAHSLFTMSYMVLMPVFAKDILGVGADLQGWLLSAGGVGAFMVTIYMGTRKVIRRQSVTLIGGAVLNGLLLAAFAITSDIVGSYALAITLMFLLGLCASFYTITLMTSLQLLIPDQVRGRVLGLYGMTYAFMPLSGLLAGAASEFIGTPLAVAMGGGLFAIFAVILAMSSPRIRNLGELTEPIPFGSGRS